MLNIDYPRTILTNLDKPMSTKPKKNEIMTTTIRTTEVDPIASFREGQVTFFNSILTSLRNWLTLSITLKTSLRFLVIASYNRQAQERVRTHLSISYASLFKPPCLTAAWSLPYLSTQNSQNRRCYSSAFAFLNQTHSALI